MSTADLVVLRGPGIFGRTLREERRALIGWVLGLIFTIAFTLALYPTIAGNEDMSSLLESYPEPLREMFDISDYTTGAGYLRAELFSLMVPLLLVIAAVLWASDTIAGEEDRRTIDVLMANPISRRQVLLDKWVALSCALGVLGAFTGITVLAGSKLVDLEVGTVGLAAEIVSLVLLSMVFATFTLAIGAATGRRGLARGVGTAVAVAAYLLSSLSELVDWLRPWRVLSPWWHAIGVDPLGEGFQALHLGLLVVMVVALLAIADVTYDRRDLAT